MARTKLESHAEIIPRLDAAFAEQHQTIREALAWSRTVDLHVPLASGNNAALAVHVPPSNGRSPPASNDAPDALSPAPRVLQAAASAPDDVNALARPNRPSPAAISNNPATLDNSASALDDEDGASTMLVVSPPTPLLHHVDAHHAHQDALAQPEPAPAHHRSDMQVATALADATAAPASALPDVAAPDLTLPTIPEAAAAANINNGFAPALDAAFDDSKLNGLDPMAADFSAMPLPFSQQPPALSDERLTAFARLRFDDGSYYMHTYQIILGRNIALAHRDMRRLARVDQLHADGQPQAAEELLNGKKDKKKKRDRRGARSVISEKGGIVNAPIESMPIEYQQRRLSNASHSLSSASHPNGESGEDKPAERAPQDVIMQAFPEVPAQFDGHVPEDPTDCPVVPIHPQHITARTGAQGPKGISRHHAKIFYNFEQGHFCVQVMGSNGLHHENKFYHQDQVVPLDHGDHLLIGAVNIQFYLPDIALTEDQRHRQESGSRPMSFSFENGHGELESDEQIGSESEGELSINPRHVYHYPIDSDIESEDAAEGDEELDEYEEPIPRPRQKQSLKIKIKAPPPSSAPKESKKAHKRKHHRELTPEEPPVKKVKTKSKETAKEPTKEPKITKEPKEPKEPKEKGKAPAKAPPKTPIKDEVPVEDPIKDAPVKEKAEQPKSAPTDSPPLLRKPLEGEIEAGEIEGLITEEMARQHNLPATLIGHVVEKRKGPGRPPKDGIMSKRQRSQLIKQAKEIERAKAAGIDPADIPAPTLKPKTPKRKESNADGEEDDVLESTEKGDGTVLGDKKQTKPAKPPRTPSPEMRIEDYSEEQLQRPSANYVVLIHEAISSSGTGQMNLQQIYNYIEKKYPWYKFKTTTSGWQSSVRHNLGQHDAFVKGDKEGKGFNWRVNPEVSIEKERRKRQVSPPMHHAQRPTYYPPPNGYPQYPHGYPYHPGMPHGMAPAAPRLPPSLAQPRLPPSMARDSNATAQNTPQGAPQHASPYASPWGGGNAAGSPSTPNPPRPYPAPSSQTPPVSSAPGQSGQYGVLYPTATTQGPPAASPYGGPYATAGPSPYGQGPPRPYAPYPPGNGQQSSGSSAPSAQATASPYASQSHQHTPQHSAPYDGVAPHPSGRYPLSTHPDLIRQLEAFRKVYLEARLEPGEDKKVDNAIRACVDTTVPEASLTDSEKLLLKSIRSIEGVAKHLRSTPAVKQENTSAPASLPATTTTVTAGTAAAIAADAVVAQQQPSQQSQQAPQVTPQSTPSTNVSPTAQLQGTTEPHKYIPNMTSAPPLVPSGSGPLPAHATSHRPSVEPLTPVPGTPVPGSPAVTSGTPLKREITAVAVGSVGEAEEETKPEGESTESKTT